MQGNEGGPREAQGLTENTRKALGLHSEEREGNLQSWAGSGVSEKLTLRLPAGCSWEEMDRTRRSQLTWGFRDMIATHRMGIKHGGRFESGSWRASVLNFTAAT